MARAKQRKVRAKAAQANVRRVTEAGQEGAADVASFSRHAAQQVTDNTSRLLETSTEQVRLAGQATQTLGAMMQSASQATQNLGTMMQAGSALAAGMQSVWQEWMHYTRSAVETNVQGCSRMLQSSTLPDMMAAQSELMQQEMELLLASSRRMSELSAQCINDAARNFGSVSR